MEYLCKIDVHYQVYWMFASYTTPLQATSHPRRSTAASASWKSNLATRLGCSREAAMTCTIARCMIVRQNDDPFFEGKFT